jgi:hypothetical protein
LSNDISSNHPCFGKAEPGRKQSREINKIHTIASVLEARPIFICIVQNSKIEGSKKKVNLMLLLSVILFYSLTCCIVPVLSKNCLPKDDISEAAKKSIVILEHY